MIVKESQVSAALQYLADPTIPAAARYYLTVCENKAEEIRCRLYLAAEGPVEERKAIAIASPDYQNALKNVAEAYKEVEEHKGRARSAEMLIEVWRTENANVRAAERVR